MVSLNYLTHSITPRDCRHHTISLIASECSGVKISRRDYLLRSLSCLSMDHFFVHDSATLYAGVYSQINNTSSDKLSIS